MMSRILAICLSACFLLLILELVRRRKLQEKYSLLWLFIGISILLLAIFTKILYWFTGLFGIIVPFNGVLFLGFFFVLLINLNFSLVISNLSEQNKKIAQKLSLLETELNEFKK